MTTTTQSLDFLTELGIEEVNNGLTTGVQSPEARGDVIDSFSPVDGEKIASVKQATLEDYNDMGSYFCSSI
jgi:aldehyde dehydrogenase (NAD+)